MDSTAGKAATTTSINAANANTAPPPQPFPMSQANGGDNEVEGDVREGWDGVEEEVWGEEGNSKIDENCECNNKGKGKLLYSIHQFLISDTGTIGINLAKLPQTRKCLIETVHADSIVDCHGLEEGEKNPCT